jgi:hypothetical protein
MSDLDDFRESLKVMRTRHIKSLRWCRRMQAVPIFFNAGFFALDIVTGNIPFAILAIAMMILGLGLIVQGTRAINRTKRKMRQPDYAYIDRMDLEVFGRTFDHGK